MKRSLFLCLVLIGCQTFVHAQASEFKRAVVDPRTKVLYYVESDLRHVAALSPDGQLLWCSEVIHPPTAHDFPPSKGRGFSILSIRFSSDDDKIISIGTDMGLGAWVDLNKKTGAYVSSGAD